MCVRRTWGAGAVSLGADLRVERTMRESGVLPKDAETEPLR